MMTMSLDLVLTEGQIELSVLGDRLQDLGEWLQELLLSSSHQPSLQITTVI